MGKDFPIVNNVKTFRENSGMTQTELGKEVGVTRQTVAAIEQCRYSPSLETAFRIARLINAEVGEVFQWKGDS